ncbi:MAG TPA: hypothetical protein VME92_12120 [Acetobacteraceae bacterium]|nr:hypothetical protein [Acetobacteraceae bacterium]
MADQSDVENSLVSVITGAIYPNGTDAASAIGVTCRIYRGWPNAAALDADLAAGYVNITVFPAEGEMRNTTRFAEDWQANPVPPTLTASLAGNVATFAGSADTGQLAGILVDGQAYAYRTVDGDTPESVAANLATQIQANRVATLSGATVTIPGAGEMLVRTVADAPSLLEIRRQEQVFRITAWCPTPALRDQVCSLVDSALSAARFIKLADGSTGRHRFQRTASYDQSQDASLYRRDLLYTVEYPTTQAVTQPSMLFGDLVLNGTPILC